MRSKRWYLYLSLLGIHICIALVAFLRFRLDPMHVLFCNEGDGLKNAFTLISYVKQPLADGFFKFTAFSYPFGDYVYYTDNTPLFAIPFRWFCLYAYDLSAYTIPIYNTCLIANIFLTGILIYYILRRLLPYQPLAYIMAIIIPWTNIQVWRIWRGHYNLSFSFLTLLAIILLMLWHKHRHNTKKLVLTGVGMVLLSFFAFLAHGYYIAIITLFIAAMLFFYGLRNRKERFGKLTLCVSFIYPVLALGVTMLVVFATDKYLAIRNSVAQGYGVDSKTRFSALYHHYYFQKLPFFIDGSGDNVDPDKAAYLGNVGLYALFIMLIVIIISKAFRKRVWQIQKDFFNDPVKASILLGGLVLLSISIGEVYRTSDTEGHGLKIINITNPFLYLHYITNRVEQFRCLERFIWPFWFAFNIWLLYTLAALCATGNKSARAFIIAGVLLAGGAETWDYVMELQRQTVKENYFDAEHNSRVSIGHLDAKQYQAILPIPYYFVGSEDYTITVDDDNDWSTYHFRLQLRTGLPFMSCKMSRVPPEFNRVLMNYVAYDSLNPNLMSKLNDKPILVAVNKRLVAGPPPFWITPGSNIEKLYTNALQFTARHNLQPVDSAGEVVFYNYYPKR